VDSETVLRAVPCQMMRTATGVTLLRGCLEIAITGTGAAAAVALLLEQCAGTGKTKEHILQLFAEEQRPEIERLIDFLLKRRLLIQTDASAPVSEAESALDLFYWNFATNSESVTSLLRAKQITIIGVNGISRQLAGSLRATGVDNVTFVDDPRLRNRLYFDQERLRDGVWPDDLPAPRPIDEWILSEENPGCIVATSDFGVTPALSYWNRYCVQQGTEFLPVVLDRLIGTVGPHTTPGETACYQCFRMREDSGRDQPDQYRQSEATALQRQFVDTVHPSMASMLGDIAALELVKYYGQLVPPRIRNLVELKTIPMEMRCRWVLKAPNCPICGRLEQRSTSNIETYAFFGENPLRKEAFPDAQRASQ
jgi:bacteriocin biosynthesis cyclodehydratase domain-containing protein